MSKKIYQKTTNDLEAALREQIGFLKRSCKSYDEGFEDEAIRLAVCIRVLVHDTSKSTSLLHLLKKKDIDFYDTSTDYEPQNLMPHFGLCFLRFERKSGESATGSYVPCLDSCFEIHNVKKIKFNDWWEKVVIKDSKSNFFTRRKLVLEVSNKEGGAHVDHELDSDWADLSKFNSAGWKVITGNLKAEPFKNSPGLSSIRQIAYEILLTLADEYPIFFQQNLITKDP